MKLTNKQLLIVCIPVGVLIIGFGLYSIFFPKKGKNVNEIVYSKEEVLPDPTASDTSFTLKNKKQIYEREAQSDAEKRSMMNRGVATDDDFFSGEIPVEKKPDASVPSFSMDERLNQQTIEPTPVAPIVETAKVNTPVVSSNKPKVTTKPKSENTNKNLNSLRSFDSQGNEIDKTSKPNSDDQDLEKKTSRRDWFYANGAGKETSSKQTEKKGETTEFIKAVIHNDQTVRSGSTVKMRITEDCIINGVHVPRNSYVSGICTFSTERVAVKISSIKVQNSYLKTDLSAFEADGIEGIYVPGGVNQEIANNSVSSAVSGTRVNANIPFVGSISTGANKKVTDPSVVLPSNYKILLKTN